MSEEMKPVAWLTGDLLSSDCHEAEMQGREYQTKPVPLYTKEQLQPRMKMTQEEFYEFQKLVEQEYDLYSAISEIGDTNLCPNLYDRLFGSVDNNKSKQNEFAVLWANFEEFEPQKTIEIIAEKKWFVRSKKTDEKVIYWYLKMTEHFFFHEYIKEIATRFDTKEQADEWTNPLTEAVLLPVGDE